MVLFLILCVLCVIIVSVFLVYFNHYTNQMGGKPVAMTNNNQILITYKKDEKSETISHTSEEIKLADEIRSKMIKVENSAFINLLSNKVSDEVEATILCKNNHLCSGYMYDSNTNTYKLAQDLVAIKSPGVTSYFKDEPPKEVKGWTLNMGKTIPDKSNNCTSPDNYFGECDITTLRGRTQRYTNLEHALYNCEPDVRCKAVKYDIKSKSYQLMGTTFMTDSISGDYIYTKAKNTPIDFSDFIIIPGKTHDKVLHSIVGSEETNNKSFSSVYDAIEFVRNNKNAFGIAFNPASGKYYILFLEDGKDYLNSTDDNYLYIFKARQ